MDRSGGRNFRIAGRRIVALEGAAPKRAGRTIRKLPAGGGCQDWRKIRKIPNLCSRGFAAAVTAIRSRSGVPPQLAASSSVIRTARTSDDRSFSDAGDDDRLCTLKRPAFEKRQGRKSRSVVRRWFGWLYGDLAAASGLGWVVMIHTPVRLDMDPAVNERVARRATRICGTSGCELSGSRRAWALSAASRQE